MQAQKIKKPFYKRPGIIIAIIVASPVVIVALWLAYATGVYYIDYYYKASKLPPEARWILEHMSSQERIDDMVENPAKYQELPCAEVKIMEDIYCFDASRVANMSIYTDSQSGEFDTLKFSFFSKILPTGKTPVGYEHVINWVSFKMLYGEYGVTHKDGVALSTPHRMVYQTIVGFREDEVEREKYKKIYQELLENNNNRMVNKIPLGEHGRQSIHSDERVFIENKIPVAIVDLKTDEYRKTNTNWKYSGHVLYAPERQPSYIDFYFHTHYGTSRDEVRHKFVQVAKEIWQFLEHSKLH